MIRVNSLVKIKPSTFTDLQLKNVPRDFYDGTQVIFMGEIPNMPGFGTFATETKIHIGYRISDFVEITELNNTGI